MSASVETPLSEILKQEFQDEDYRYAYDEEFSNSRMATQIKVIREQRGLKQSELADLAEMRQSRISALEDVNYNAWSISTLRRLARALGVRLFFGFESWGELLPEIDKFGRDELERPKFDEDQSFKDADAEPSISPAESIKNTSASLLRAVPPRESTPVAAQSKLPFDSRDLFSVIQGAGIDPVRPIRGEKTDTGFRKAGAGGR